VADELSGLRPRTRRAVPIARLTLVVALTGGTLIASAPVGATAGDNLAPFESGVANVSAAQLGRSWHRGCPLGPIQLRLVHLRYVGFDRRSHNGTMVVNERVTGAVIHIFATLYARRFPVRLMVPASRFDGSDPDSMAADNTSGFNCRYAVASGPRQWSVHAYGEAIDVNPVQNPYVLDGTAEPAAGTAYVNRSDVRAGMAVRGGVLVNAFASVGWYWGGRWSASPDYQHFSATGG
jgi:hypothetical protein